MTDSWRELPLITLPSPLLALATGNGGLWAGGLGGVARFSDATGWRAQITDLTLAGVAALAYVDGWLLAGGGGGIARSKDGGRSWQTAEIGGEPGPITALAPSPNFAQDTTLLAATFGSGVLRSRDAGATWTPATFGLQSFEITAIAWGAAETVVAATADGIYRSPNAGRAWQLCPGTERAPFAALAVRADGAILAAVELGGLVRSRDAGRSWARHGDLPPDVQITTLYGSANVLLLGTMSHGLLRSADDGLTWLPVADGVVLSLAGNAEVFYAGTDQALLQSDAGGQIWRAMPQPPLPDLRRLLVIDGALWVLGLHSPPVSPHPSPLPLAVRSPEGEEGPAVRSPEGVVRANRPATGWQPHLAMPTPLLSLSPTPGGALVAAGPTGLARSTDGGASWSSVAETVGQLTHLTFRAAGQGWAGSADGAYLFRTRDDGLTWEPLPAPFGILPLAALWALPETLFAATYDARRHLAQIWRSDNEGESWQRGAEVQTPWPVIATHADPPLLTLGGDIFCEGAEGEWDQIRLGHGGIRRIVGDPTLLLALTTTGLYQSRDGGRTWIAFDANLPLDQLVDLALDAGTLYALLAGGRVWTKFVDR